MPLAPEIGMPPGFNYVMTPYKRHEFYHTQPGSLRLLVADVQTSFAKRKHLASYYGPLPREAVTQEFDNENAALAFVYSHMWADWQAEAFEPQQDSANVE